VFTPERLTDEHRLITQTVAQFVDQEVLPQLERLDHKDWNFARHLVERCAELGLLGVDVAEADGGLQLDKVTSVVVSEELSRAASFGATFGAQVNLIILPLSLFGTEDQKHRYLPRLLSGEWIGAYCLSESGSGSDALGAKTRAIRQADGSFVLSGEKLWITNGGFADLFVVFAKVDGEHFSAFVVERQWPGVSTGKEEHKMGLHGSSTTPVLLQDVRVPAGNLLGEIGKGHLIAFNVLNFARLKLGAMCAGGARYAIGDAARYAAERRQFGRAIASFGAIKHKLGEMVSQTYAIESLIYRTAGMIDARIRSGADGHASYAAALNAYEEYAIEASIAKVAASEMLDFVLDENIQIHGGNGFVRDYAAERQYRDARVNRIFEGTNEINRLLIPGLLGRRAAKGTLTLAPDNVNASQSPEADTDHIQLDGFKKTALMVLGLAQKAYGPQLSEEQEVLLHLADIVIDTYAAESALLRASGANETELAALHRDASAVYLDAAALRVDAAARQALGAILEGEALRSHVVRLEQLVPRTPVNATAMRRRLADQTVAAGRYPFRSAFVPA
jgi:alkylation response protein AidB-like acyl-CoA dehydrogenase